MTLKYLLSTAALASALISTTATATPFTINANSLRAPIPGTNGITAPITELNLFWSATSIFTDDNGIAGLDAGIPNPNPLLRTPGDSVIDSGVGRVTDLAYSGSPNPFSFETTEGFNSPGGWGLGFRYSNLVGEVVFVDGGDILAQYSSGTISIFAVNGAGVEGDELLELTVIGSAGQVGLLEIFTKVSGVSDDIFFLNGTSDFSDYPLMTINARIDFGLDGLVPTQNGNVYTRTSRIDGSAQFDVPEPGIVALLGLGLIGIGAVRRRQAV